MSFESSAVNPVQRSLFPFRLTWLACVCAVPAHAGEVAVLQQVDVVANGISAPTEQDTHYQTKSSALATQTETPLVEIPQSVSVISQQQLDDRQPQSLDEALSSIAGLRQSNTLGGTQDAIAKRGFGGNRDNSILRNGMQSVQARNFTPTTQRIEVLKGPASLLYGIQDPGGVINVVTKKPQAEARYQAALARVKSERWRLKDEDSWGQSGQWHAFVQENTPDITGLMEISDRIRSSRDAKVKRKARQWASASR